MCISALWVLNGKDCTPGCDVLHRHPLLSIEFTCTYILKVPEGSNGRESSEELVHAIVFMLPTAHPNKKKEPWSTLLPHFEAGAGRSLISVVFLQLV